MIKVDETYRYNYTLTYGKGKEGLLKKLNSGRKLMPCGKECEEFGFEIAKGTKHGSFENFKELMNNRYFLLEIAKITPNPCKCEDYFFNYINPYLKNNKNFRIDFLKQVYLNDDVYSVESVVKAVEICGLEKENEQLLKDDSFKKIIENRLESLAVPPVLQYNLSGKDAKAMHQHKIKQNEARVRWENQRKGLKEILATFASNKKKEEIWF